MSSSESELSEASEPPSSDEEYEEESEEEQPDSEDEEDEEGTGGVEVAAAADGIDGGAAAGGGACQSPLLSCSPRQQGISRMATQDPLPCCPPLLSADGGDDGEELEPTQAALEERRQQNIRALVSGAGLNCRRAALMPRLLTVQQVISRAGARSAGAGAANATQHLLHCRRAAL